MAKGPGVGGWIAGGVFTAVALFVFTAPKNQQAGATVSVADTQYPEAASSRVRDLMKDWLDTNNLCRGSSDQAVIEANCFRRDRAEGNLRKVGWCWVYSDDRVLPVDYGWHKCTESAPAGWVAPPEPEPFANAMEYEPPVLVSADQYAQIRNGMTYPQVARFLGNKGDERWSDEVQGLGNKTVVWENPDGSRFVGTFQNGWLTSKMQIGLR